MYINPKRQALFWPLGILPIFSNAMYFNFFFNQTMQSQMTATIYVRDYYTLNKFENVFDRVCRLSLRLRSHLLNQLQI